MPQADTTTTGANAPVIADPGNKVYNPPAVGTPHCVLFNNGQSPVYLGGTGVTINSGLWFPPGAQLSLPFAPYVIWSVSGYVLGTATTTLSANLAAGGTTIACGSLASMSVGTPLQIGNTTVPSSNEVVVISTFVNAGTLTTTSGVQYDHISGGTVTVISSQTGSSISVNAGTT